MRPLQATDSVPEVLRPYDHDAPTTTRPRPGAEGCAQARRTGSPRYGQSATRHSRIRLVSRSRVAISLRPQPSRAERLPEWR